MITETMINDMIIKGLPAIGGILYISEGKVIGVAYSKAEVGRASLNRFYSIDKNADNEEFIKLITNIMNDALYGKERGLDFSNNKNDVIDKQIKKDKREKKINDSLYVTIDYGHSDYLMDQIAITLCDRDGSAWIGRKTDTYIFEKYDLKGLINKIKSFYI